MIEKTLLGLGFLLTPFLTLYGSDNRSPKLIVAVAIATILSLVVFFAGGLKPFKNKALLFLAGWLLVSSHYSLPLAFTVGGIQFGNSILMFTVMAAFSFLLMILSVYSIDFSRRELTALLKTAYYCGFVMSLYLFCQWLNLDQFFYGGGGFNRLGGFLGNPCISSAFIAMLVPVAISLRKYWQAALMAAAVCLTWRHVAIFSLLGALVFMFSLKSARNFVIAVVSVIVALFIVFGLYQVDRFKPLLREIASDSGRVAAWHEAIEDLSTGGQLEIPLGDRSMVLDVKPHPITGFGPGAFGWANRLFTGTRYAQAHNEYVEVRYDLGMGGLLLLLASIGFVLKRNIRFGLSGLRLGVLASFVCSCLLAGGMFVWHIGPIMFFTAFMTGLLHKEELTYD